ncbi:MAG: glutamate-5-semialdehyde dehydrogenase [Actinobacteria bacterium]|nr:glutamate-5-semialdehyde dehydrogenase [Actinomycetota bacterium]
MSDLKTQVLTAAKEAKAAVADLSVASTDQKNRALKLIADALIARTDDIITINKSDVQTAIDQQISAALIDRLTLTPERITAIAKSVVELIALPDPIGVVVKNWTLPNGLEIEQRRVPLGVIAMIYEARPNVTVDAAALCLKSGNVALLRGSSTGDSTNEILVKVMRDALVAAGLPADCIVKVPGSSHDAVTHLIQARGLVDLVIPRGSASLIESVVTNARVPVIETGVGNCHIYLDENLDLEKAINIVVNSKTQRVSVCNAAETLLVHKNVAEKVLPKLLTELKNKGVTIHGDLAIKPFTEKVGIAFQDVTESDWHQEYYSLDIAAGIVDSFDDALTHIKKYSTGHTEAIVTNDAEHATRFANELDSAAIMINASTRFVDGGEFGFGAEIGISTQKLHARGPMGIAELTSTKYVVTGDGQVRN